MHMPVESLSGDPQSTMCIEGEVPVEGPAPWGTSHARWPPQGICRLRYMDNVDGPDKVNIGCQGAELTN